MVVSVSPSWRWSHCAPLCLLLIHFMRSYQYPLPGDSLSVSSPMQRTTTTSSSVSSATVSHQQQCSHCTVCQMEEALREGPCTTKGLMTLGGDLYTIHANCSHLHSHWLTLTRTCSLSHALVHSLCILLAVICRTLHAGTPIALLRQQCSDSVCPSTAP